VTNCERVLGGRGGEVSEPGSRTCFSELAKSLQLGVGRWWDAYYERAESRIVLGKKGGGILNSKTPGKNYHTTQKTCRSIL